MNKTWIFATMVLTLAASCSRDKDVDNLDNNNKIDDTTIEEIVLGAGQSVSVTPASRGIGAVGDLAATNSWNGETVYVYGINKNATGDAQFAINGQAATAPVPVTDPDPVAVASGALTWTGADVHYYYNGNDVYDFYGAHVDKDAIATPETAMKITAGTNLTTDGWAVNVTINGSQDLMVAKTDKANDITNAEAGKDPDEDLKGAKAQDYLYSAWSARRGVTPNLVFTHLLSRLNFQAKCGSNPIPGTDEGAKDMIKITKIEVLDVYSTGKLQIIPTVSTPQGFTPDAKPTEEPKVNFVVFAESTGALAPLEALQPVDIVSADYVPVGADLLVYPEQQYNVVIYTQQDMNEDDTIQDNEQGEISTTIKLAGDAPFVAGAMYDISITVYGLEEITVNATLTAWTDGGEIEIDPDDMPEIPTTEP